MDSVVLLGTFSGRNYAAVLMQQGLPATTYQGGGLFIADVTSLTAPTFNNSFTNVTTNSVAFGGVNSSQSMTLAGGFLYITFDGGKIDVVNVSNPTAISLAGTFNVPGATTMWASAIVINGSVITAYLNSFAGASLYILNVSNPAAITVINQSALTDATSGVVIVGNYAFLGDTTTNSLIVFNISAVTISSPPVFVGSLALTAPPNRITVSPDNSTLYITPNSATIFSVWVVNITTPTLPTLATTLALSGPIAALPLRAIISGNTMYIGQTDATGSSTQATIDVYNITTPLSPVLITTYDSGYGETSSPSQIDVDGSQNIYQPVRNIGGQTTSRLLSPEQLQIYTPISPSPLSVTPSIVSPAYYNTTGQLIGGSIAFCATAVSTSVIAGSITTSPIGFSSATPISPFTATPGNNQIPGNSTTAGFPIKNGWVVPRTVTITNLWVISNPTIASTITGGNLRYCIFTSLNNGNSYSPTTFFIDFTPAQMTFPNGSYGPSMTGSVPGLLTLNPGTVVALVPVVSSGSVTGSITADCMASISFS